MMPHGRPGMGSKTRNQAFVVQCHGMALQQAGTLHVGNRFLTKLNTWCKFKDGVLQIFLSEVLSF